MEVRTWLSNALKKEEEIWTSNKPEIIDGCYFSNLALDVIPVRTILDSQTFFMTYMTVCL